MDPAAFTTYLACIGALGLNLIFLTAMTIIRRAGSKQFTRAEDAEAFKGELASTDPPAVAQAMAAHNNALESFVPFAILGWLYVYSGGSATGASAYFITFTVARWLHSIVYLRGLQPWRTLLFVIGFMVNLGLSVQLLIKALG
jgi:uncharacterized MAPEG superfamily protein